MPDSGVSASEEVTLPAIHGNRPRDRNIHPRGRETIGDRCNYLAQRALFTGGPCSSPGYLPPALSLSISFHLLCPSAHCLPTLYSLPSIFFFSHWHGCDTYASPFRIPHMRCTNPPSLFIRLSLSPPPFLLSTSIPLYVLLNTQDPSST